MFLMSSLNPGRLTRPDDTYGPQAVPLLHIILLRIGTNAAESVSCRIHDLQCEQCLLECHASKSKTERTGSVEHVDAGQCPNGRALLESSKNARTLLCGGVGDVIPNVGAARLNDWAYA